MIRIGIDRLHLHDDTTIELPNQGIVVIVGPNNAGKSVFLQEMYNSLRIHSSPSASTKWVLRAELMKDGDMGAYFDLHARVPPNHAPGSAEKVLFPANTGQANHAGYRKIQLEHLWNSDPITPFGAIADHFSQLLGAMDRGRLLNDVEPTEPGVSPTFPLHFIDNSYELQEKVSRLIRSAFGFPVSVNRYSRRLLTLLRGEPTIQDTPPPPSEELVDQYNALTPVRLEGDGIRSFVGLLITALSGGPYITLIDEPEAYLHPPQAKLLGRYLAEEPEAGGQLVVATHSSDFLEGLLDGAGDREVSVLRVSIVPIEGKLTRVVHTLPPDRVSTLWSDPLMRYSRMLDGLFHNGIIVCEADNDCRFYSAAIDRYLNRESAHDLVLTHVGGKGRLSKALERIRPLHMKAAVVTDLDILNNKKTIASLMVAAGGKFGDIEDDLEVVTSHVLGDNSPATVRRLKAATKDILNSRAIDSPLTDSEVAEIVSAVRVKSGWKTMKMAGISGLPPVERNAATRIISHLATIGIFVVQVGELERWYPDIEASHGEPYVTAVLENGRLEEMPSELKDFIASLCKYFGVELAAEAAAPAGSTIEK